MMMVNHLNNNSVPWQSTIPDQMPWLNTSSSAACPTGEPMQFLGHPPYSQNLITPTTDQSTHIDLISMPSTKTITTTSANMPHQQVSPIPINPFDPQLSTNTTTSMAGQFYNSYVLQPSNNDLTSSISSTAVASYLMNSNVQMMGSLTPMPHPPNFTGQPPPVSLNISNQPIQHKRSSIEMEDDLTTKEAPPTKQQLSENILFDRFGSLQLDGERGQVSTADVDDIDEIDIDSSNGNQKSILASTSNDDRKEFNRYVYLLFKDKNSVKPYSEPSNSAVDRLIREEREKLSKAVVVWTPPQKPDTYNDSDDDDFRYTDHKDFLKRPPGSSVIITELEEDVPIKDIEPLESDDVMVE